MVYHVTADAGSSKTEWLLSDEEGRVNKRIRTEGINASLAEESDIEERVQAVIDALEPEDSVAEVKFYGAGCATTGICAKMSLTLQRLFGTSNVDVDSDLLGAARALLGNSEGIACILGTGSNSCHYDGEKIVQNVPSLGFILGDEGSGSAIGKRLLSDSLKGIMPVELSDALRADFGIDTAQAIERIYRQPAPNRYLASFAPFAKRHIDHPYITGLLLEEFGKFLDRNVMQYERHGSLSINFTGGIAFEFEALLREACSKRGLKVDRITKQPF